MPRITVSGGASNPDALPGDVGYIEPAAPAPAVQWRGEPGPELTELPAGNVVFPPGWTEVEAPEVAPAAAADYGSMTQAALRDEAKSRGLSSGGTKADLAARLAEHDAAQAGDA